jgi:hypothetical protein
VRVSQTRLGLLASAAEVTSFEVAIPYTISIDVTTVTAGPIAACSAIAGIAIWG